MAAPKPNNSSQCFTAGDPKILIDAGVVGLRTVSCGSGADPHQIIVVFPFSYVYFDDETDVDFLDGVTELRGVCPMFLVGISRAYFYRHSEGFFEKNATASLFYDAVWLPDHERICFMPEVPFPVHDGLAKLAEWDPARFSSDDPHPRKAFVYIGVTSRENVGDEHIKTNREINSGEILSTIREIVTTGSLVDFSPAKSDTNDGDESDLGNDAEDEMSDANSCDLGTE